MLLLTTAAFYLLNERFAVPVRGHSNWSLDAVRVAWLTYDAASRVRVIVLVAGVVLALGLTRVWCRYLCPLGALLTLGNRIGLFRLRRNRFLCGDCIEGCTRGAVGLRTVEWLRRNLAK